MNNDIQSQRLILEPESTQRLANLCGRLNEHLHQIEQHLKVTIKNRSNTFLITGEPDAINTAIRTLKCLYTLTETDSTLSPEKVHLSMQEDTVNNAHFHILKTPKCSIKPRGEHQNDYVQAVIKNDIIFGIGPAGTGKTYLAVACAVEALINEQISRILLVRPAVEAGEKLGFLPGDLAQKVDPYLRPLYDALYDMLGFEKVAKLIERNIIEIAPLAYMRGRTLNNAFIILDESQNTTASQMKMFLTRIGFGSTAVITGDVSQIDLPKGERSGLVHVSNILNDVEGVNFTFFNAKDVVRHPIVQRIVEAYDEHDNKNISALNERVNDRDS